MAEEQTTEKPAQITQADIDALKLAKDKERDEANALRAKVKELERQNLALQSKNYGDEEKVKNAPLFKALENENATLVANYSSLEEKVNKMTRQIEDTELAKEIGKEKGILPTAIEDAVQHARSNGFVKTEKGWISTSGKNLNDFINELKVSKPHYWAKTVGSKEVFNQENIADMQKTMSYKDMTDMIGKTITKLT